MPSSAPRVVVYTTDPCGWCRRAKELLERHGMAYREEWIPRTAEGLARLASLIPGARSFPQIVIDGEPIGGFQDLLDHLGAGPAAPGGAAKEPDTA